MRLGIHPTLLLLPLPSTALLLPAAPAAWPPRPALEVVWAHATDSATMGLGSLLLLRCLLALPQQLCRQRLWQAQRLHAERRASRGGPAVG